MGIQISWLKCPASVGKSVRETIKCPRRESIKWPRHRRRNWLAPHLSPRLSVVADGGAEARQSPRGEDVRAGRARVRAHRPVPQGQAAALHRAAARHGGCRPDQLRAQPAPVGNDASEGVGAGRGETIGNLRPQDEHRSTKQRERGLRGSRALASTTAHDISDDRSTHPSPEQRQIGLFKLLHSNSSWPERGEQVNRPKFSVIPKIWLNGHLG